MCDSQTLESQMQNDRNLLAPAERLKQLWWKSSCQEISGFYRLTWKGHKESVDISDSMQMKLVLCSVQLNLYFNLK